MEQNPHWEINWIKDREKAFERCGKLKPHDSSEVNHSADEKLKLKKQKLDSILLEAKEKKRKKKSKRRKKRDSSGSSSSSSSSDSSSEEEGDKSKSIRVAMRNKMRMQAQLILKEEMEGKLEALGRMVEEKQKEVEERQRQDTSTFKVEDNIINQWMSVTSNSDKHLLEGLKGRLKQRQEQDKERSEQAALEQRKRERLREELELKEMREREQLEQREREQDEREREKAKERERSSRRRHHSPPATAAAHINSKSRSRSRSGERQGQVIRKTERNYRKNEKYSPEPVQPIYKPKRSYHEEERNAYESHFEKQTSQSAKTHKQKKATALSNRKLPFIGRMPLFKKKGNDDEKEIKKEEYEIRLTKFEAINSVKAYIPAPGVAHIMRLATPVEARIHAENPPPPPPPQIIPEPPTISESKMEEEADAEMEAEAPPPPSISAAAQLAMEEDVDKRPPPGGEGVATSKGKAGGHLPRDFQDALNIIYPGGTEMDPSVLLQQQYHQYGMGYSMGMGMGMMYPGMQIYDYSLQEREGQAAGDEPAGPSSTADHDDLAMLGIDAEDMAAQTI